MIDQYIELNDQNQVVYYWTDAFDISTEGRKFVKFEGEHPYMVYFPGLEGIGPNPNLFDNEGAPMYKWVQDHVEETTEQERAEYIEEVNRPPILEHVPEPTTNTVVKVLRAMASSLPLSVAVEAPELYPEWKPDIHYGGVGQVSLVSRMVNNTPLLFKCRTPHISQSDWTPENTPSLWFQVVKEGTGTYDDPFIVSSNLSQQYYKDKYYKEGDVLYLCIRDSEIPIAYKPSQLIGQYFEVVQ